MIKSMTGYGRNREIASGKDILVEVKSVNSRYIDATVKTGRLYIALEEKLKSLASEYLSRGGARKGKRDDFARLHPEAQQVDDPRSERLGLSRSGACLDKHKGIESEVVLHGCTSSARAASMPHAFSLPLT